MNKEVSIIEAENVRDIDIVTNEINSLLSQAQCLLLTFAIEIGRRLVEAKSLLPHGEWGSWLKEKVGFSQSSANNYMKIFDEYGDEQITLFGAVPNSQTLGNLPYTKALKLLALPSEEREDFVKDNKVEDMSSRELEQAIKERNEARAAAEKAEKEKEELQSLLDEKEDFEEKARAAGESARLALAAKEKAENELLKAKENEKKAKEALKNLKENPEIPDSITERLRTEAEAEASEKAKKELESTIQEANKKIDEALGQKKQAENDAKALQVQIDALKKEQKMNNPAVMEFKVYFSQAQEVQDKLINLLGKIREEDPETAGKLGSALAAVGKKYIQCGGKEE